jgi:membrane-bound lytic murein transglycosylase A
MTKYRLVRLISSAVAAASLCTGAAAGPEAARPLAKGASALRKIVDRQELPDLRAAFEGRDAALLQAVERSVGWFENPSTRAHFPLKSFEVSHERARISTLAFRELLRTSADASEFQERVFRDFDVYASVGWDGKGTVLFTGYYTPSFRASRTRTDEFRYPLYARPPDLLVDPVTDQVLGRSVEGKILPYPARAEIERDPGSLGLAGREIAWFRDKFEAFLVQVQGAARLDLLDGGEPIYLAYAGNNGRSYTSLGKLLAAENRIERDKINTQSIHAFFRERPHELDGYLNRNERYIFFRETVPVNWPAGSLGLEVTPLRSLATDKSIFPRGCVVLVKTKLAVPGGGAEPFDQFMVDQDAGGAILAPGRGDIYVGMGDAAAEIAGRQAYSGRLYYFLLKPERLSAWNGRVKGGLPPTGERKATVPPEAAPAIPPEAAPAVPPEPSPPVPPEAAPAGPAEPAPAVPAEVSPAVPAEANPAPPSQVPPAAPAEVTPALPPEAVPVPPTPSAPKGG